MSAAQFRSILSITTGLVLIFLIADRVSSGPSLGRGLFPIPRRDISIARCEQPVLKNGVARLKQRRKMIKFDCSRGYRLIGPRYAACSSNGKWDSEFPVCAKRGCYRPEPPSNGFLTEESGGFKIVLFCQNKYQVAGNTFAFCDGSEWDRKLGTCRETTQTSQLWCDFETEDFCGWYHDDTHDFEWKRYAAHQIHVLHTGPNVDHTYQDPSKGHYMLLEATDRYDDERARLISPLYDADESSNACFSFSYHMYGALVGSLRVLIKPLSVDMETVLQEPRYLFFNISGNQRNLWHKVTVDIDQYSEPFQVVIEGSSSLGHLGDTAIDDVAIFQGTRCAKEEEQMKQATNGTEERGGIFDYESCNARCDEIIPSEGTDRTLENGGIVKKCDCHEGCEDLKTCCPDYRRVCVFGASNTSDSDISSTDIEMTRFEMMTTNDLTTERRTIAKEITKLPTPPLLVSTTLTTISTSTVNKITKQKTTTTTSTTHTRKTTKPSTVKPTTPKLLPTKSTPPPATNRTDSGQITSTTKKPIVTTFHHTELIEPMTVSDKLPMVMMQDDPAVDIYKDYSSDGNLDIDPGPLPLFVILICMLTISTILSIIVVVLRYYRKNYGPENYKKNAEVANRRRNGEPEEFSDVRYLASDEQIDFTLQTPQN